MSQRELDEWVDCDHRYNCQSFDITDDKGHTWVAYYTARKYVQESTVLKLVQSGADPELVELLKDVAYRCGANDMEESYSMP
jgi:hypothetical protein